MYFPFSFERPEWLWLLVAIPVIVAVSLRSLKGLEPWRRVLALAMRSLVIVMLAASLARIQYVKRNDNVAVVFLLDRSKSIPEKLRMSSQEWAKTAALEAKPDDRVGMISFDGVADVDLIPSRGGAELMTFGMAVEPDRTDMASALRMALASFPEGFARRVVMMTDGNENAGQAAEEIEVARANGVAIDIVPLQYEYNNEILFDRISVPTHVSKDSKVPVRLVIKSRRPSCVKLDLYHNDTEIRLEEPILELEGGMRANPFTIDVLVQEGTFHRFDAQLTPVPATADSIVENNRATAFTFVEGPGRVLLLTQPDSDDERVLYDALLQEKLLVDMRDTDRAQIDLARLLEYNVVILSNVPANLFNEEQHKALAGFVKDQRRGLIMIGGDESFGAGGWIGTPVEEISPVAFDVQHRKVIPRGALVIVMHSCEIARGNYWGEQVAIASVNAISSLDYIGIICYSWSKGGPNWDVPLQPATDKPAIRNAIKNMQIGDMPDFATTMDQGVKALMARRNVSQRHMIIISDGDPSPPSSATLKTMVDNRITCSTVGIGFGSHVMEGPLKHIANRTGGQYYPVKNPKRLPQIFIKEAKVIKRPLLQEEPFQPQVSSVSPMLTEDLMSGMPQLGGLVLTQRRPDAIMPISRKTTDGDDPVFAHWNYEGGKVAAFTSGLWSKWGIQWASWGKFRIFWKQVVESIMGQPASADFDIVTRLEGNEGHVVVEALDKNASFLNWLQMKDGSVTQPNMESRPLRLIQTGPGRYEGTFEVNDEGNYLIAVPFVNPQAAPPGDSGLISTGLSVPYSPEYRELGANMDLLRRAAEETGGRILGDDPFQAGVFDRNLPPSVSRQPIWRWVVCWLLIPLFILDVAGRRLASILAFSVYAEVAVFAFSCAVLYASDARWMSYVAAFVFAELAGWAIRYRFIVPTVQFFTSTVRALAQAGARSEESLTQLKDVREKVREGMESKRSEVVKTPAVDLAPAADSKRRYDLGDVASDERIGDLTASVGGATVIDESDQPQPGESRKKKPAGGDLASRLRRAKQRAQDELKKKSEEEN